MMKCIFDLEGTLGVFSSGLRGIHFHDLMLIRPESKKGLEKLENTAIATRAPKHFVNQIIQNLDSLAGIRFNQVHSKEDVSLTSDIEEIMSFKNYNSLMDSPENTAIVGDFLRFPTKLRGYDREFYRKFSFSRNPQALTSNFALNDHPLPQNGSCPVYIVVPQMWGQSETLSMGYIAEHIKKMAEDGNEDLIKGFDRLRSKDWVNEYVIHDGLSRIIQERTSSGTRVYNNKGEDITEMFKQPFKQRYVIMKGNPEDWKKIEYIDTGGNQNA